MHEQTWRAQVRQMLNAQLLRFAWWMQRIRKQKEAERKIRFGRTKHRNLASTIGVPAEEDAAWDLFRQKSDRVAQACAIALGVPRKWRSRLSLLPKREITAQNRVAMAAKLFP